MASVPNLTFGKTPQGFPCSYCLCVCVKGFDLTLAV